MTAAAFCLVILAVAAHAARPAQLAWLLLKVGNVLGEAGSRILDHVKSDVDDVYNPAARRGGGVFATVNAGRTSCYHLLPNPVARNRTRQGWTATVRRPSKPLYRGTS